MQLSCNYRGKPGESVRLMAVLCLLAVLSVAKSVAPRNGLTSSPTLTACLEERGNVKMKFRRHKLRPENFGNAFSSATIEFEYGATGWWTTEVTFRPAYLE